MAIKDDDLLYVQRPSGPDAGGYKETVGNLKTELNDEYLSKTTDDTAAGEITFEGKTVHESGIQITGNNTDNFENKNSRIYLGSPTGTNGNYSNFNAFNFEGRYGYNSVAGDFLRKYNFQGSGPILSLQRQIGPTTSTANPQVANFILTLNEGELNVATSFTRAHTTRSAVNYKTGFDNTKNENGVRAYAFLAESNSEYDQLTADATAQASFGGYLYQADTSPGQFPAYDEIGFHCRSTGQLVGSLQGFVGDVRTNAANTNYNFYTTGTAPNFFRGDTYIGGNTARNTFELWKSTLTEEQVEQLEAGTLVAPTNVATPGNGEFARQWWYDRQSAEDQALIDSGELEYPSHFQAVNFTDTFALGDNTNVNLMASGASIFKGDVFVGGTDPDNIVATRAEVTYKNVKSFGVVGDGTTDDTTAI